TGNVRSYYRTAKRERFERWQVLRAKERHVSQRKSATIKYDEIFQRHGPEKRNVERRLEPGCETLHVFQITFVRADEHKLKIKLLLLFQFRLRAQQVNVIFVRPKLRRVKQVIPLETVLSQ